MTAATKTEFWRAFSNGENPSLERFLVKPAQNALASVIGILPTIGAAVGTLIGLWIVARIARALSERLLELAKLDEAIEETLIARILSGLGEGSTPSKVLATLVYFAILLMAFAAAADILGLAAVRAALLAALAYLPRLAAALAVLGVGGYVARTARRAIASVMKELKSPFAGIAESLTEGLIMLLTVTVCVNQLGADLSFITNNLAMILGAFFATAAFLFAWAMRKPAEEIIANYYLRRLVRVGDQITIGNVEGTVDRFAALGLLLKDGEGCEHFIPARHVLDGVQRTQSMSLTRSQK